jgi:putative glutamine amidotransferase
MMRVALPFGYATPEDKRNPYRQALAAVHLQPVENAASLAGLDGLLLAGGSDVDPELYGAPRHAATDRPDHDRDRLELALLREALDRNLPVLAICRGLQLLNVALGGTLVQHIEGHKCPGQPDAHLAAIAPHSRLKSILRVDQYPVNSRHHQCVDRVADGLVVAARAPDGVIEALELPTRRFVVAVQWHPEDRTSGPDAGLFEAFRDALRLAADAAKSASSAMR